MKKNAIMLCFFGIVFVLSAVSSNALAGNPLSSANFLDFKDKKAAPDFALEDLEDNPIRLSAYKGKVVLLYFWTTW